MGAIPILAIMATTGIINMDMAAVINACTEQFILFPMKGFLVFGQNVADLSAGDIHSPLAQLLSDQGLSYTLMVMLVENITSESRAEVCPLYLIRENTGQSLTLGRQIARQTVTGVKGLDQQILNGVILIAQQA